jgi:DNA-binding transcriptional MerR regulator
MSGGKVARGGPVSDTASQFTVRQLADEFGVTTRTLRYYETEGLLAPQRVGTARLFSQRDRARLRLVLRGRRFGMSLDECREVIDMYDGAESSERKQLEALLERLGEIASDLQQRRTELQRTLREVHGVAAQCRTRLAQLTE